MTDKPEKPDFDFADAERQMLYAERDHFIAVFDAIKARVPEEATYEQLQAAAEVLLHDPEFRDHAETLAAFLQSRGGTAADGS